MSGVFTNLPAQILFLMPVIRSILYKKGGPKTSPEFLYKTVRQRLLSGSFAITAVKLCYSDILMRVRNCNTLFIKGCFDRFGQVKTYAPIV